MDDLQYVYATAGVIGLYFLLQVATRRFDPFAPVWLFFVGYVQIYVIQAINYHDWAIGVRGEEVVTTANSRALWALVWFLAVYHVGAGRLIAPRLPRAPQGWSTPTVAALSPVLIVWGLFCAGVFGGGIGQEDLSAEGTLLRSFPFVMMVAAILLITTGRRVDAPRPAFFAAGLAVAGLYVLIWMFNAKRSHSLMGVLTTICAIYVTRLKRPSWGVLGATAFTGALVVAVSIGWRNNPNYERSIAGFGQFVSEFEVSKILVSMDVADDGPPDPDVSYESKEYGGYLLMLDTVPEKSGYDYGANYLRAFSTYIPRIIWPSKPIYGRTKWIDAWIAGSELKRDEDFAGPAIGILGATHLNGGVIGTVIVMAAVALALRTSYDYFLLHARTVWGQFFWAIFFYNAWFVVVGDDPVVWYYYNWGFSACPVLVVVWFASRYFADREAPAAAASEGPPAWPGPHAAPITLAAPAHGRLAARRFTEGAST
ncbi:hypothetical protein [Paludisphaera mucosa]|uniref:Oligosaccharide repeat unit polymerase n=1 Tax=Paludisphaera mucosa TaxID=3030827 RepID=A0ABT6FJ67_9BACT|nr:hypothetical protein [Paludisphaera mucosa]MDG3007595.1 hypothetical protein [Paludisphaera mucosa]